ncbi:MAG: Trk potassium uptake system protein TrkH, partial [uncultured Solirubrobacteraceae bacterium]
EPGVPQPGDPTGPGPEPAADHPGPVGDGLRGVRRDARVRRRGARLRRRGLPRVRRHRGGRHPGVDRRLRARAATAGAPAAHARRVPGRDPRVGDRRDAGRHPLPAARNVRATGRRLLREHERLHHHRGHHARRDRGRAALDPPLAQPQPVAGRRGHRRPGGGHRAGDRAGVPAGVLRRDLRHHRRAPHSAHRRHRQDHQRHLRRLHRRRHDRLRAGGHVALRRRQPLPDQRGHGRLLDADGVDRRLRLARHRAGGDRADGPGRHQLRPLLAGAARPRADRAAASRGPRLPGAPGDRDADGDRLADARPGRAGLRAGAARRGLHGGEHHDDDRLRHGGLRRVDDVRGVRPDRPHVRRRVRRLHERRHEGHPHHAPRPLGRPGGPGSAAADRRPGSARPRAGVRRGRPPRGARLLLHLHDGVPGRDAGDGRDGPRPGDRRLERHLVAEHRRARARRGRRHRERRRRPADRPVGHEPADADRAPRDLHRAGAADSRLLAARRLL